MITVHAYEDSKGRVIRLLSNDDKDRKHIELIAADNEWDLLHTYPIEDAARFK